MNILITGASGLIGSALTEYFTAAGHSVAPLIRGEENLPFCWKPEAGFIHLDDNQTLDVVINLAGPGVADRRWSTARKREILEARVTATRLLCEALAARQQQPAVLISASAIGYYGPRDASSLDESAKSGSGFLADVARQWEAATEPARQAKIRTVHARFGIVLSAEGGALRKMLLPFKLGLGGVIGRGRQFMSWVALQDVCTMIDFLIIRPDLSGPVNLVSPNPVDNREFTRTLGKVLGRPTVLPMPSWLARLAFGEMAEEVLLTGARVMPGRLEEAGYEFQQPTLEGALATILHRSL